MNKWFGRRETDAAAARSGGEAGTTALADHGQLLPPTPDLELVSTTISADQRAVALWARDGAAKTLTSVTTQPGWASFPDSRTSHEVAAVVCVHDGNRASITAIIPGVPIAHPTVHVLPGDLLLMVGARAHWKPSGPEHNAMVFDARGKLVNAATFGDGIEQVQTTRSGDIWVGYFDEGVYGNYGWGSPGPTPLGWSGIVRFNAELELIWEYPSHVDQPWGSVDDCYALNVDEDRVWACYFSDFPVVRIESDAVTAWENSVRGARAIAVCGDRIALFGGYGDDRDRLVVGRLDDGQLLVETTSRVVMPEGGPLPQRCVVQGRGESLHVITGNRWLKIDPMTS